MFNELLAAERELRELQAEPSTGIAGGGNIDNPRFQTSERDRDDLDTYEAVYRDGGPVAALIDTRAWMIHGTGAEFVTDDDDMTARVSFAEDPVTPAEWLDHHFPDLDNLLVSLARDAYVYGDWLTETVETRGNGFDRVVTINPKTMEPRYTDSGTIEEWVQFLDRGPLKGHRGETFSPDEIGHGNLYSLGRHPLGVSLIGRAMDQIERFEQNQRAIAEALQKHAFTRWHVKVNASVDDNELRRIRQRFHQVSEYRELTTGRDIEIEPLDDGGVGESITDITEHDLMTLATTTQVPEEMAGLGRGSTEATAKVRLQAFERMGRGEQRDMAQQFIREVIRDILENYSPFPRDASVRLKYGDIVSDESATAEYLRDFKASYTNDEIRKKFGDGPVPDDAGIDGDASPVAEGDTEGGADPFGAFMTGGGRGTGNRELTNSDAYDAWEETWHDLIEHVLWSDDAERALFSFSPEDVPLFVTEKLRAAIDESLFSDFDSIPDSARMVVRETMLDSLDRQHGWSVSSIADNLQDAVAGLSDVEAERVARTETASLVNTARAKGYRERLDLDEARFKWVGPSDSRTTDACRWLESQTNPDSGGSPVSLGRLKELIQEAPSHDADLPDDMAREFIPHIQCRHTYVRHVE